MFHIGSNEFSGPLQDRFNETGLDHLIAMALEENMFTGAIPPSLEELPTIRIIRLHSNEFEGAVPNNICNIRSPNRLVLLEADCDGDPPANECSSCTSCCLRHENGTLTCRPVTARRLEERAVTARRLEERLIPASTEELGLFPQNERLLQPIDCAAQYRWDRETGLLEEFSEEAS